LESHARNDIRRRSWSKSRGRRERKSRHNTAEVGVKDVTGGTSNHKWPRVWEKLVWVWVALGRERKNLDTEATRENCDKRLSLSF